MIYFLFMDINYTSFYFLSILFLEIFFIFLIVTPNTADCVIANLFRVTLLLAMTVNKGGTDD